MRYATDFIFGLLSQPSFAHGEAVESLKTIIKDTGVVEREKVNALEDCKAVMTVQQRLMQMIRPEYKQKVSLKEFMVLEVFRADNTTGYAAKCIFRFPSK